MSKYNLDKLKLIYILKIGKNSKGEGLYEFIFSEDPDNVDYELWCWDISPACDNVDPPDEDYIDATLHLKTSKLNLWCLHEADDREYMHGFYNIHALAYETDEDEEYGENAYSSYENLLDENDEDDIPLVFHYGESLKSVKDKFYSKDLILKGGEFISPNNIKL